MTVAELAPARAAGAPGAGAPGDGSAEPPRRGFRPDIEGLRAVAVLSVLLYHAGLPVHAGFVGVDIFFVISGFLITGLLVAELDRTGTVSWPRFLGRRIRRLLPAAVLVLVVTSFFSWLVVPGLRLRSVGHDVIGAATYVVNWVLAGREVDYLASDARPSPVQHFWSLSVEEQFYVVWPLLLVALAFVLRRLGRTPDRRTVGLALGVLVGASFLWSVGYSHSSPAPAFFVTTTRVWELGVGALLAVWLTGRERPAEPSPASVALGWAGLVALVVVAVRLPTDVDWPGAWALLPTLPTALVLWSGWHGSPHGPVRLLGTRPMVRIGGLSYSIYLWHWPVLVLGDWSAEWLTGDPLAGWAKVALAAASVWPAWVSWRFVEQPLHHGPWLRTRPRALLAAGLALSSVGVLAALPLLPVRTPFVTTPPGGRMPADGDLGAGTVVPGRAVADAGDPGWVVPDPLRAGEDRPAADVDRCQVDAAATEPVRCTFGDPQGPTTIALVGDSKAMQWLPALQARAGEQGWRIVTYGKSACAFADAPAAAPGSAYPECDAWNAAVVSALAEDPPDLVVTSGVARGAWDGRRADADLLVDGYARRWSALATAGSPVVVVGDSPLSPDDLDVCAARHPRDLEACTFDAAPGVAGSGLPVQRRAAAVAGEGVRLLDLTERICPGGRCPVVIGHVAVHRPGDHLTATYARTLAPAVAQALTSALGPRDAG
ncbi:acyltransferase family protein [Phycicoccus sonneratiae]|uniref:Acyltransferase n=1 Tax=Phycicoccus sonneratiae TaxID=2807628 RepID=A0ABS2CKQ7_9MICO|nr:acyltransferase family protein [Phycicoccus sonneraticus]MBM6400467.1 acyltransferase [Phycicoccus sonneraticus]